MVESKEKSVLTLEGLSLKLKKDKKGSVIYFIIMSNVYVSLISTTGEDSLLMCTNNT